MLFSFLRPGDALKVVPGAAEQRELWADMQAAGALGGHAGSGCLPPAPLCATAQQQLQSNLCDMRNARLPQRAGLSMTRTFKYALLFLALGTRR